MRTVRRSGARDLPPSADSTPVVIISPARPSAGEIIGVMSPAGVALRVRVTEIVRDVNGWIGWGDVLPGLERELRQAGVPESGSDARMRIFDWQLLKE